MSCLVGTQDRGVGHQWEVNSENWNNCFLLKYKYGIFACMNNFNRKLYTSARAGVKQVKLAILLSENNQTS